MIHGVPCVLRDVILVQCPQDKRQADGSQSGVVKGKMINRVPCILFKCPIQIERRSHYQSGGGHRQRCVYSGVCLSSLKHLSSVGLPQMGFLLFLMVSERGSVTEKKETNAPEPFRQLFCLMERSPPFPLFLPVMVKHVKRPEALTVFLRQKTGRKCTQFVEPPRVI